MKVTWTIIGALGFAISAWVVLSWRWFVDTPNQSVVGAGGFFVGVFGLYGSVIGFTIAFHQIRKSINATEAAETALIEVKDKITFLNASGEIERARFALEETERSIHAGRIKDIKYSLAPARQCLLRIVELDIDVFSDLQNNLNSAIIEIAEILDRIDSSDKDYIRSVNAYVRSYSDLTSRTQVRMSRG